MYFSYIYGARIIGITYFFCIALPILFGTSIVFLSAKTGITFLFCMIIFIFFSHIFWWIIKKSFSRKVFVTYMMIFSLFIPFGIQKNNVIYGNYQLISLDKSLYNFNILNIFQEDELIGAGLKAGFLLGIDTETELIRTQLQKYQQNTPIQLPSQIPNAIINKKEHKYIVYTPPGARKDTFLMILHGNAGGFLFYQQYWKEFADTYKIPIIMPLFGWGNWNEPGGKELIYNSYYDCVKKGILLPNTSGTIFGLSNGGVGIGEILKSDTQNIFKNIIGVSIIMSPYLYKQTDIQNIISQKTFFLFHGIDDTRAFYSNIEKSIPYIPHKYVYIFKNEGHFLLFTKQGEIQYILHSFFKSLK